MACFTDMVITMSGGIIWIMAIIMWADITMATLIITTTMGRTITGRVKAISFPI